ncbi:ferritin-like domain-containing protein [Desulfatibacillum aliphaticivorans]|uniref:Rubrerythrin n=1 Tax=Desulfatibacillum aliphaticivorans TaxID=218208 RepID=B8FAW2_DESAL|nr:ferritin family protein [Desulfatibacillum aliphaticivorans]ACL04048.1 rubrerythrin [Desulfatibacillum aliphaticivorans]
MAYEFSADEIFAMAEEIEKNGAKFYSDAAAKVDDADNKQFLEELAAMERNHEKVFAMLRADLAEELKNSSTFDPAGETGQYLKSLADMRVFFKKEMDFSSMKSILKDAIVAEKDSIVLYLGMKDLVDSKEGRAKIDLIIKEEMGHVTVLTNRLTKA